MNKITFIAIFLLVGCQFENTSDFNKEQEDSVVNSTQFHEKKSLKTDENHLLNYRQLEYPPENLFADVTDTSFKFYTRVRTLQTNRLDTCKDIKKYVGLLSLDDSKFMLVGFIAAKYPDKQPTGATFDIFYTKQEIDPIYIFEGLKVEKNFKIRGRYLQNYPLTAGQYIEYRMNGTSYTIYATGDVELKTEKDRGYTPIKSIDNYKIHLSAYNDNHMLDTVLYQRKSVRPDIRGYVHAFGIDWYGDLNGDTIIDFVALRSTHYSHMGYSLFISSSAEERIAITRLADYDIYAD